MSFEERQDALDIQEIITTAGSPWQNTFTERIIGSIRRECLDHMIKLGERHLKRIISGYVVLPRDATPLVLE